ncbi:UDP-glucuronosyltransferase 2C1-like [Amphiura filiformis]|uniref:UDP-glucuronosyltransferase 2C1-like n=1 Tax=Amphiura filiformis TaxID=82378 RepID=UPI003B22789D
MRFIVEYSRAFFFTANLLIHFDVGTVKADNYLAVLMLAKGSHLLATEAVLQALTDRGHNVSLLIPPVLPEHSHEEVTKNTNVTVINTFTSPTVMKEIAEIPRHIDTMVASGMKGDKKEELFKKMKISTIFDAVCESFLSNATFMNVLRRRKFDLMFADIISGCPILIAQSLQLKYTTLTTMILPHYHAAPHRSPINPSYIPVLTTGYSHRMNFAQRLTNALLSTFMTLVYVSATRNNDILKEKYGIMPEISTYNSLGKAEIWFINSHFALEYPRPLVPNAVLVGGLTAKPSKHLNKDLEAFMQQSGPHGVVVFSLGTYMDVMETKEAEMIADAFASIPQKVIWKKSGQTPANVSNNVHLVQWMPQNDILGHKQTRLFISHCGLNSAFEALYHAVPIVCIPIFADQLDVAARVVSNGIGLQLNLQILTTTDLQDTIRTVLQDKRFQENMDRLSSIYRDEPLMPAERVAYWMEYVVRHSGTSHLKSAALDLNFFQYYLLDVAAFLTLFVICFIILLKYLFRIVLRRLTMLTVGLKSKSE